MAGGTQVAPKVKPYKGWLQPDGVIHMTDTQHDWRSLEGDEQSQKRERGCTIELDLDCQRGSTIAFKRPAYRAPTGKESGKNSLGWVKEKSVTEVGVPTKGCPTKCTHLTPCRHCHHAAINTDTREQTRRQCGRREKIASSRRIH